HRVFCGRLAMEQTELEIPGPAALDRADRLQRKYRGQKKPPGSKGREGTKGIDKAVQSGGTGTAHVFIRTLRPRNFSRCSFIFVSINCYNDAGWTRSGLMNIVAPESFPVIHSGRLPATGSRKN